MDNPTDFVYELYHIAMLLVIALPPIVLILFVSRVVGRRLHRTVVPRNHK